MEEVGRMDSGRRLCLVHAMEAFVNFAFWPYYSQDRTPVPIGGWVIPRKISYSFGDSNLGQSNL
jgi:hypothetical protein